MAKKQRRKKALLSDAYVVRLLMKSSFMKRLGASRKDISPENIELKRQQLIMQRELRASMKELRNRKANEEE